MAQNRNPSVASPKPGDPETEKHMTEQKNVLESQGLWRSSVLAEEKEREGEEGRGTLSHFLSLSHAKAHLFS